METEAIRKYQPASVWPLLLLLLATPLTCWAAVMYLPSMDKRWVYGLAVWTMVLFCYAHRMVYFYYLRKAKKWVYAMALPCVLVLYPALFMCLLFVAALEQSAPH